MFPRSTSGARALGRSPLVSVVIPCFNHGQFLREALDSVGVTTAPSEIIVVDDGSTDSTRSVVEGFRPPQAFCAVRQPNAGLAAARNRGLRESRGEFIIFLDADDRLLPGAVDIGVRALLDHPACAFTFGRCVFIDRNGVRQHTNHPPLIPSDHYRQLLRRNYIWMPAMVTFRRDALERAGGFDAAVNAAADYDMYLRIARHHPVHDHGRVVAEYRRHDSNMSRHAVRMLRETLAVLRAQRPFLEGDTAALDAYAEGWRNWQEYYGDDLATEIRRAFRGRRLREAAIKALVLGRYHPRGLLHHIRRKTEVTVGRANIGARPEDPLD